jgi:hypothetical protein
LAVFLKVLPPKFCTIYPMPNPLYFHYSDYTLWSVYITKFRFIYILTWQIVSSLLRSKICPRVWTYSTCNSCVSITVMTTKQIVTLYYI